MSYDISKVNCISGCVLLERKASQNPKITCTVALCECASELLETDEVHKCVYRESADVGFTNESLFLKHLYVT